jgi:subtilase family serine protease
MVIRVTMAVPRSNEPIPVSARADVPNQVAELNEGNNLNEQELTQVVPGPF